MDKPTRLIERLRSELRKRSMAETIDIEWDHMAHRYWVRSWNIFTKSWWDLFKIENPETHQVRPADESAVGWILAELQRRDHTVAHMTDDQIMDGYTGAVDRATRTSVRRAKEKMADEHRKIIQKELGSPARIRTAGRYLFTGQRAYV